ncbi:MAG: AMP-dependent synthetase, partial [Actinomycetota bacterium]
MINHYIAARQELEGPGSPFAVTTVEVRGQQLKAFAAAPPNMRVVWEMTAAHGDKKYLVYEDES